MNTWQSGISLPFLFCIMAENKKSFVLYVDQKEVFNELSDSDAGQLIKHIFSYVSDENPITENPFVKLSFILIKAQLKRDLVKYEDKKIQWSEAGKKSAEAKRLLKENNERSTKSTDVESVATESTVNDNVNVTVNVNDNVIVKEKKEIKKQPAFDFSFVANNFKEVFDEWIEYKKEIKDSYSTQKGLELAYNKLLKYSGGKVSTAKLIIEESISNNWKGFFEYKGKVEIEIQSQQTSDEIIWQKFLDLAKIWVIPQNDLLLFYPNRYDEMLTICESGVIPKR